MGTIARFDLVDLHRRFGVRHFVETGTGAGDSLAFAAAAVVEVGSLPSDPVEYGIPKLFKGLWSCEINDYLARDAKARFNEDPRIRIFRRRSEDFLEIICDALQHDGPILFWLDAHFPGADYSLAHYGVERDDRIRLPLEIELGIIARVRPAARDVIICDDLRIYADGPFQHGNVPDDVRPFCPRERNIDFVHRLMDATHDVRELYEHEGYILITPKER